MPKAACGLNANWKLPLAPKAGADLGEIMKTKGIKAAPGRGAIYWAARCGIWAVALALSIASGPGCLAQPPGWQGADMGLTVVPGGESYSNGSWTVTGSGAGVYGNTPDNAPDSLHFTYTQVSGDIEFVARLSGISGDPRSEAGLMMRTAADGWSDMAAVIFEDQFYDPNNPNPTYQNYFINADRRAGIASSPHIYDNYTGTAPPVSPPVWLKIVRLGNDYSVSRSADAVSWTPVSDFSGDAFLAGGGFELGFFVCGGAPGQSATAVFDSVYLGPPRLDYRSSWVGNSFSSSSARYVSGQLASLYVAPDGTCYANSAYDEAGEAAKIYKDGTVVQSFTENGAFGNNGVAEGSVTGDGQYIYILGNSGFPYRTDPQGNNIQGINLAAGAGRVGGMAAGNQEIYFSDVDNNCVRVASAATLAEIANREFPFARPGPMAVDGRGDLWIIQRATDYPNTLVFRAQYPAAVLCYHPDGTFTGRQITDLVNPSALCWDAAKDQLMVCENGPDQNIRIYKGLAAAPALCGTFGRKGGVFTGGMPGRIDDPESGGYRRLYGPNGVGVDAAGNTYVSCSGGGTHLRKFDPHGNLVWNLSGLEFVNCGDFDPATDGEDLYEVDKHFKLDLSRKPLAATPGSEWRYAGFSWNPFGTEPNSRGSRGTIVRRFGPAGSLFMFSLSQSVQDAQGWPFYRFNGELAVPCGRLMVESPDEFTSSIWVDSNGDGMQTPDEVLVFPTPNHTGFANSIDVGTNGDIYALYGTTFAWGAGLGAVSRFICQGVSPLGVPIYTTGPGGYEQTAVPPQVVYPARIRYDAAKDAMFVFGGDANQNPVLARFDQWSTGAPVQRFLIALPTPATSPDFLYFPPNYPYDLPFAYFAMDVAGDMVFMGELWGPIHAFNASTGQAVINFNPGPEVSGVQGWTDMWHGLRAFQRKNGEYLVVREDAGYRARNLLFRWDGKSGAIPHPIPVVITAGDASSVYGDESVLLEASVNAAPPSAAVVQGGRVVFTIGLNGTIVGSVTSDQVVKGAASARFPLSGVGAGAYSVTASYQPGGSKLNFQAASTTTASSLTVKPKPLTITAQEKSIVYGASLPVFTAAYDGFVNGDNSDSLSVGVGFNANAPPFPNAGKYVITPGGAADPNYVIKFVSGTLMVAKAGLTITADNKTRTQGSPNPPLSATCSGFLHGDTLASLTAPVLLTTTANIKSKVGAYTITPSQAFDPNYTITFVKGILTVTP